MIHRETGETYLDYVERLTNLLNDGLIGYNEYGVGLLGRTNTYAQDNIRKAYYVIKKLLPHLKDDMEYTIDDEEREKQLQLRERELYKAAVQLRDQRRELRKWDTSEARFNHLVDVLKESVEDLPRLPESDYKTNYSKTDYKTAVLMLSDWHYGAIVDTQYNFYDSTVAKERAQIIFDKCIRYCTELHVRRLFIEINGDMVHGLINVSNRVQSEEDVIEQIVQVSELLAQQINRLKPYYESITVVSTMGNHGRLLPEKNQSVTKENFEKLITEFLRLRLDESIKILHSHSEDFIMYECDGRNIFLAHGQYDKINSVIGTTVSLCGKIPDEIHLGHTHSYKDIDESDIIVTVNGSLMGSDDYALTLRKNTKPNQNLIIYGKDRCVYKLGVEE